jgi:hypothetical protein
MEQNLSQTSILDLHDHPKMDAGNAIKIFNKVSIGRKVGAGCKIDMPRSKTPSQCSLRRTQARSEASESASDFAGNYTSHAGTRERKYACVMRGISFSTDH